MELDLESAREKAAQFQELQAAAAGLAELEKRQMEQDRLLELRQQAAQAEGELSRQAADYRIRLAGSNLEIAELIVSFSTVIRRRRHIDQLGERCHRLAQQAAGARIGQANGTTWGFTGQYGNDRELLLNVASQILAEYDVRLGAIQMDDSSDATLTLLDALARFCNVTPIFSRRYQSGHSG